MTEKLTLKSRILYVCTLQSKLILYYSISIKINLLKTKFNICMLFFRIHVATLQHAKHLTKSPCPRERGVICGPNVGQIGPKWDKSDTFQIRF